MSASADREQRVCSLEEEGKEEEEEEGEEEEDRCGSMEEERGRRWRRGGEVYVWQKMS